MPKARPMKTSISAGELRALFSYDPETGQFKWRADHRGGRGIRAGDIAGVSRKDGYRFNRINGVMYCAHRLAWLYVYGEWPAQEIDHINRNHADNRIANLRQADRAQNAANIVRRSPNKTGFKGVYYHRRDGLWCAKIHVRGKCRTIGYFKTAELAGEAYREAAKEHHGEFVPRSAAQDRHPVLTQDTVQGLSR